MTGRLSRFGICAGLATLLGLAAPVAAAPAPPPPPYTGAYQPIGVDEIGLWREMDEDERLLATSPLVVRDPTLNAYVRDVLCSAVGADRCKATRIYIIRAPVFNASMAPNGTMRVYTGLLLRVGNEAELATVLGHEFAHFEQRHSLAAFKAQRTASDITSWALMLAAMTATAQARADYSRVNLSVYGGFYHFKRDQEREADSIGIGYLNASPLRSTAAPMIWVNLIDEAKASARARGLGEPKLDKIAYFASHPPEAERAVTMALLADPAGAGRDDGSERYARAIAPFLGQFIDDQIKRNDFGGSEYIITSRARSGWTAPLWLARGELYRARANPRDLVNAAEFYSNALAIDPSLAEAHRGLGIALLKTGQTVEGQTHLRRYIELRPDASDASAIRMLAPAEQKVTQP